MVSPFGTFFENTTLKNYGEKIISTQNEYFLLEYGALESNIIYLCTAKDVLSSVEESKQKMMTKIYFPHLFKKKIYNVDSLRQKKQTLLATNKKLIDANVKKYNNTEIKTLSKLSYIDLATEIIFNFCKDDIEKIQLKIEL